MLHSCFQLHFVSSAILGVELNLNRNSNLNHALVFGDDVRWKVAKSIAIPVGELWFGCA